MAQTSEFDGIIGLNLYNQNGGVAPNRICGQGVITKLLGSGKKANKVAAAHAQSPLTFGKDPSICLSPVGKPKKIKFHRNNLYENMNMSSIDTESCSSDEPFSETSTGSARNTTPEFESPEFVAQFDPNNTSPPMELQHRQPRQQSSANSGSRKLVASWSASLPAVVEEDSQSEQGSQNQHTISNHQLQATLGIWRNGEEPQSPGEEETDLRAIMGHKERIIKQRGEPSEAMSLHESHRIESPSCIPHYFTTSPSRRSRAMLGNEDEGEEEAVRSGTSWMNRRLGSPQKRLSRQEHMKEAVDKRIRRAMDEAMLSVESEDTSALHMDSIDSDALNDAFDPFQNNSFASFGQSNSNMHSPSASSSTHDGFIKESNKLNMPTGSNNTMQELLLQQQMTLKEMSLQNSHYRQELSECQEIFGKWKLERDKQRSTIQDLVKEKEAYATEASFLRNEMSSIRLELESLRRETRLQAEFQGMPSPQQHLHRNSSSSSSNNNHRRPQQKQQALYAEGSRPDTQAFRHQQPRRESPLNEEPSMADPAFHYHQQHQQQQPPFQEGTRIPVAPPPPPPPPRSRKSNLQEETLSSLRSKGDMLSPSHSSSKQGGKQPFSSSLKSPLNSASKNKQQRSVKFQDPPKSKEWTLFPEHLHDDRLLECSFEESLSSSSIKQSKAHPRRSDRQQEVELRHEPGPSTGEEPMQVNVQVPSVDSLTQEEEPTPIAANGRVAGVMASDSDKMESTNVYKNRLETVQKNRQQRFERKGRSGPDNASSGNTNHERIRRRSRSRPPALVNDCS